MSKGQSRSREIEADNLWHPEPDTVCVGVCGKQLSMPSLLKRNGILCA